MKTTIGSLTAVALLSCLSAGCGSSGGASYSFLSTGQSFKQATVNAKVDMLWVVDNSGSMLPLQQNMTSNFNSFISEFVNKGYDFHLAVTSSDSYKSLPQFVNDPTMAQFSDGVTSQTGVFDIVPGTLNLINTFVTNASLQANGSGDERAFSSFKAALSSPLNAGFLRPTSFMAIIILSDEDDFSDPTRPEYSWTISGGIADHAYTTVVNGIPANPNLETVESYESYLDTLTGTTGATRRYSVSAITVMDDACQAAHQPESPTTVVGYRYMQMASDTSGVVGSVCDTSYAASLTAIENHILELSTQFFLNAPPVVSSIVVTVNGVKVPTDPTNGWTYNSAANSVVFHGAAIPPSGASINVAFDPSSLTF